ncbi:hypothetical protein BDN71DRAFT_1452854 [Pleurotus eryngii]|uniref:Uncharacterized protein n=1 Tax=Pleurotus eryngii TaxID=5323 RepID=A0A9P5ZPV5_PLEER|nr:hypothetical protein BDN71DRAFT_1452854 [Pleurotus eryngii]
MDFHEAATLPAVTQPFLNIQNLPGPPAAPPTIADAARSCVLVPRARSSCTP